MRALRLFAESPRLADVVTDGHGYESCAPRSAPRRAGELDVLTDPNTVPAGIHNVELTHVPRLVAHVAHR
jgi:hypothetical protein